MNDNEAIGLLRELVEAAALPGGDDKLTAWLQDAMSKRGFASRLDPAGNVVGTIGDGEHHVMLVSPVRSTAVSGSSEIREGALRGPGAASGEGALAAMLAATARVALRRDRMLRYTVVAAVEADDGATPGLQEVIRMAAPDLLIVGAPTGWDAVASDSKGVLGCTVRLEDLPNGVPAAERASAFWNEVQEAANEFNGGRDRERDRLRAILIGVRSDADTSSAEVDLELRLPLDLSPYMAEGWLRELASPGEFERRESRAAWRGGRTLPIHECFERAIDARGGRMRNRGLSRPTALNVLGPAFGVPAIGYGPGREELIGKPGERMDLVEFVTGVGVLQHSLSQYASHPVLDVDAVLSGAMGDIVRR